MYLCRDPDINLDMASSMSQCASLISYILYLYNVFMCRSYWYTCCLCRGCAVDTTYARISSVSDISSPRWVDLSYLSSSMLSTLYRPISSGRWVDVSSYCSYVLTMLCRPRPRRLLRNRVCEVTPGILQYVEPHLRAGYIELPPLRWVVRVFNIDLLSLFGILDMSRGMSIRLNPLRSFVLCVIATVQTLGIPVWFCVIYGLLTVHIVVCLSTL